MSEHDVVIVGGGVVGLAIAWSLVRRRPDLSITVVEREPRLAAHASGRNSGVLHAGFYYSPDSLKAAFTREGNARLRELLAEHGHPVRPVGKVVVTQHRGEVPALQELARRGVANGVEVELRDAAGLGSHEPRARTVDAYLWSPTTAVAQPSAAVRSLADRVRAAGGQLRLGAAATVRDDGTLTVGGDVLSPRHLVNAAGAYADRIAHTLGHNDDYVTLPFLGRYLSVPAERLPLRRLVYPVPNPEQPFLGVHLTTTATGALKIGPTALPVAGRELADSARGAWALRRGDRAGMVHLARAEAGRLSTRRLVAEASRLVPDVACVRGWVAHPPGIRAQLVHRPTGRLEMDFVVRGDERSTHVLNAVSPGWTCSLPFGDHVADRVLDTLG
jgi:L-2-hydroxyglutarate oxidase